LTPIVHPKIRVFNTLTRRVEDFEPFVPGIVRMYVCGPTVYDETHVGHARTYVAFDALRRFFETRGYTVIHVQNITDIDDKIINKARETGRHWTEIVEEYTKDYLENIEKLGIRPHVNPRVTLHIKEIIEFIQELVNQGYAYASGGSVYFDVTKYSDYGRLSGRTEREAWRQEEEFLQEKKNPFDFAVWKKRKPGEPYWSSPWGPGRPGWHIECSVMSIKYLGSHIDIHGGGQDLIFPHHENERAQCEVLLSKKPWVKYWMHTGMLVVKGEKMSKSLGNVVTLKELLGKFQGGIVRTWILSSHYRSQLEFNEDSLEQARRNNERITNVILKVDELLEKSAHEFSLDEKSVKAVEVVTALYREFQDALSDDFNTSRALGTVLEATRIFHRDIEERPTTATLLLVRRLIGMADYIYGFTVGMERREHITPLEREIVEAVIRVRRELRKKKHFEAADMIREELSKLGILLVDHGLETRYYYRRP